jgi:hypothetical protein
MLKCFAANGKVMCKIESTTLAIDYFTVKGKPV